MDYLIKSQELDTPKAWLDRYTQNPVFGSESGLLCFIVHIPMYFDLIISHGDGFAPTLEIIWPIPERLFPYE